MELEKARQIDADGERPEFAHGGGMVSPKGPHVNVWEYDEAFKCLDCQAQWGALDGRPVMPEFCNRGESK
jgi:hypothetical protein